MNTSHVITTTNADTGKRTELDSYGPVGFNHIATIRESFQCVAVGPSSSSSRLQCGRVITITVVCSFHKSSDKHHPRSLSTLRLKNGAMIAVSHSQTGATAHSFAPFSACRART